MVCLRCFVVLFSLPDGSCKGITPKPYGPVPAANQWQWQKMDCYAFPHFPINTFIDQEGGSGGDHPKLFNPNSLDCRQRARICKEWRLGQVLERHLSLHPAEQNYAHCRSDKMLTFFSEKFSFFSIGTLIVPELTDGHRSLW